MKKEEKAKKIGEVLDDLYPAPPIPLQHIDPFTLLVAVVLSAQTTDVQVNKVTPALFARANTPAKVAAMSESDILKIIRSCGLAPGKARNIQRLAHRIVEEHGGKVPNDISALEKLPGVGHKTASVVVSQAFGEPAFAVDTHIHRLAARWGLSSGKNVEQTERDLKKLFPRGEWARRHLQIIYFGREYCPARNHDFDACPICSWAAPKSRRRMPRSG
jgi:endonuclease-3